MLYIDKAHCLDIPLLSDTMNVFAVFDFDWSLINENSDTWVIEQLCPQLIPHMKEICKDPSNGYGPGQWTKVMDHMISLMMLEHKVTKQQLKECLQTIPIFDENIALLHKLHDLKIPMAIVSDANEYFIDAILETLKINDYFSRVITNKSSFEMAKDGDGNEVEVLRVRPHQPVDAPHSCTLCPVNLCKGLVMNDLDCEYRFSNRRVVYVGDGGGDRCPCIALLSRNISNADANADPSLMNKVCCRKDWSLHKGVLKHFTRLQSLTPGTDAVQSVFTSNTMEMETHKAEEEHQHSMHKALQHVHPWENGEQLQDCIMHNLV